MYINTDEWLDVCMYIHIWKSNICLSKIIQTKRSSTYSLPPIQLVNGKWTWRLTGAQFINASTKRCRKGTQVSVINELRVILSEGEKRIQYDLENYYTQNMREREMIKNECVWGSQLAFGVWFKVCNKLFNGIDLTAVTEELQSYAK